MALQSKHIFVNLPVKDVKRSMDFFGAVGFEFNMQFTDDKAACLVVGENIFAMLLQQDYFQSFTKKEVADATKTTEVLIAISADSKAQVNEIVEKALASGGAAAGDAVDHGFMYQWNFQDPDGHIWEVAYMDMNALPQE